MPLGTRSMGTLDVIDVTDKHCLDMCLHLLKHELKKPKDQQEAVERQESIDYLEKCRSKLGN